MVVRFVTALVVITALAYAIFAFGAPLLNRGGEQDVGFAQTGSTELLTAEAPGPQGGSTETAAPAGSGAAAGPSGEQRPPGGTGPSGEQRPPGAALLLTDEEGPPTLVVLQPGADGGVALGVRPETLLLAGDVFATVGELHAAGEGEAVQAALATILGIAPTTWHVVQAETVRGVLQDQGQAEVWPEEALQAEETAKSAAAAVLALAALAPEVPQIWEALAPNDASSLRETFEKLAPGVIAGSWDAFALPGRTVRGAGFEYFEADVTHTQLLLAGRIAGAGLTVQVQNGSGEVGVAEAAADLLAPLGMTVSGFGNAAGFPEVKKTLVRAAPGALDAARQVRVLLGVGEVVEDADLKTGRLLVIIGRDFVPPEPEGGVPVG